MLSQTFSKLFVSQFTLHLRLISKCNQLRSRDESEVITDNYKED
jgi:hypothetical protein